MLKVANFSFISFKHSMIAISHNIIQKTPALRRCIAGAVFCLASGLLSLSANKLDTDVFEKQNKIETQDKPPLELLSRLLSMTMGGIIGFILTGIGIHRNEKYLRNSVVNIPAGVIFGGAFPMTTSITALAGTLGLTVLNKILPPQMVKDRTKRIFLENYSQEESEKLKEKYSALLEIKNKNVFIYKTLKELVKDFKLEQIPIKLKQNYKEEPIDAIKPVASLERDFSTGYTVYVNKKKYPNIILLTQLTHEMRHIKQDLIEYMSCSPKEMQNRTACLLKDINKMKNIEQSAEEIENESLKITNESIKFFRKYDIYPNSIKKDNPLYKYGRMIHESRKIYANKSVRAYDKSFYERDAGNTELLMRRFVENKLY